MLGAVLLRPRFFRASGRFRCSLCNETTRAQQNGGAGHSKLPQGNWNPSVSHLRGVGSALASGAAAQGQEGRMGSGSLACEIDFSSKETLCVPWSRCGSAMALPLRTPFAGPSDCLQEIPSPQLQVRCRSPPTTLRSVPPKNQRTENGGKMVPKSPPKSKMPQCTARRRLPWVPEVAVVLRSGLLVSA
jgi:hypothetical protein